MDSFQIKRTVQFRWLPGWGSCAGKNGMAKTPFHKLPLKAWPTVNIVHLQWSRHKRRLWCSSTCFMTFCTDGPVSFLAMRQLSAYLRTFIRWKPSDCLVPASVSASCQHDCSRQALERRRTSTYERHVNFPWPERGSSVVTGRHSDWCTTRWECRIVQLSFLGPVSFVEF